VLLGASNHANAVFIVVSLCYRLTVSRCEAERAALEEDRSRLSDAKRRSERFKGCEALMKTLAGKRQTQAQLDEWVVLRYKRSWRTTWTDAHSFT
jgi:hypothetical protein